MNIPHDRVMELEEAQFRAECITATLDALETACTEGSSDMIETAGRTLYLLTNLLREHCEDLGRISESIKTEKLSA